MFVTRVISDGGLVHTNDGFELDIRLPWYRSLPLSTVSIAELMVDGHAVPLDAVTFLVNGKSFALDDLIHHPEEWWFVLDSVYLDVRGTQLQPGTEHDISVTVGLRPPYIPGFYRLTECTKRLTAK